MSVRAWGQPKLRSFASGLILAAPVAYVILAQSAYLSGRITMDQAALLLVGPVLALVAALRPAWLVLGLVALPPGVLNLLGLPPILLVLLVLIGLGGAFVPAGSLGLGWRSGVIPLALLIFLASWFRADVSGASAVFAQAFFHSLIYYALLCLLAFNLTRRGELGVRALENALLVGFVATGVTLLFFSGFNPSTLHRLYWGEPPPAFAAFRLQLGMLMTMGFSIAVARSMKVDSQGRWASHLTWRRAVLIVFMLSFVAFSYTRAAWLGVLIMLLLVAIITRKTVYFAFVLVGLVAVLQIPVARERAFADVQGGFERAVQTGQLGSGRWGLWTALLERADPPWGRGFGYMWTLSPTELFGRRTFVTAEAPFVFPHSDVLFWYLELGIVGLVLVILFWSQLVRAIAGLYRRLDPEIRRAAIGITGVALTMLLVEILDNGIFMRGVAERFFVIAGLSFGLAASGPSMSVDTKHQG